MIDERSAIYASASLMWAGWALALFIAAGLQLAAPLPGPRPPELDAPQPTLTHD